MNARQRKAPASDEASHEPASSAPASPDSASLPRSANSIGQLGVAAHRLTTHGAAVMRLFSSVLVFHVCAALASAAGASFVHIWPGWREAESFDRISEYFGGAEPTGRETILRTQPATRAGYYFLVRVKNTAAAAGARFELSVIRGDSAEAKVFRFPADLPAREAVFQLGLTGADWPGGKDANPVAWKVALLAADGRLLAEHKSFLWEKPAK